MPRPAQGAAPTPSPGAFPTIAGVGVGVDEACVKYLLSKSVDELLRYLGGGRAAVTPGSHRRPPRAAGTALLLPVRAALTSGTASPMDLMASTSLTLQPSQNSAVSTR